MYVKLWVKDGNKFVTSPKHFVELDDPTHESAHALVGKVVEVVEIETCSWDDETSTTYHYPPVQVVITSVEYNRVYNQYAPYEEWVANCELV